ncbi:DUF881 domain-containing protein [Ornithinimicrobium ciconiae]|uniref:DUF881 domain-containing protein n=1 Tax=Ornithinimicrobium ciconiae TaxID=2594265 RepID=A0A516GAZ6_9MICO|nr:DUF881 domain-containing protein [Ornithinimicrobium ciconiae]QDO88689.1 DUF881 domain-containing protein [Ornithinimicrobium ciconiae]
MAKPRKKRKQARRPAAPQGSAAVTEPDITHAEITDPEPVADPNTAPEPEITDPEPVADPEPTDPEPVAEPQAVPVPGMPTSVRHAWRRLARLAKPRASIGNVLAALMTLAVGFALVAQVQAANDVPFEELRESDLIALLDDVSERADTLEGEIRLLEADKRALADGSGAEAAAAAESRLTSHQILAGSVPVEGQGITMTVSAPEGGFTATMMIDLMQELRNAGAEAIQIGPVRVVADTWIGIDNGRLSVSGQIVDEPFRIIAIGDSHTLAGAMAIPGGFADSVRGIAGNVQIVEGEQLIIDALHQPRESQYARPVPSE